MRNDARECKAACGAYEVPCRIYFGAEGFCSTGCKALWWERRAKALEKALRETVTGIGKCAPVLSEISTSEISAILRRAEEALS